MPQAFRKDPDATLDYTWDWSSWLASGDTIASYVIDADAGITVDSDANDTTSVTVTLSGGTVGETYEVRCEVTTADGLVDERTLTFRLSER